MDFDLINKSSLQQSHIKSLLQSTHVSTQQKQETKPKSVPPLEKHSSDLALFNEIFLFGLSPEKNFKEMECLWNHTNPRWKFNREISEEVNLIRLKNLGKIISKA